MDYCVAELYHATTITRAVVHGLSGMVPWYCGFIELLVKPAVSMQYFPARSFSRWAVDSSFMQGGSFTHYRYGCSHSNAMYSLELISIKFAAIARRCAAH